MKFKLWANLYIMDFTCKIRITGIDDGMFAKFVQFDMAQPMYLNNDYIFTFTLIYMFYYLL